MSDIYALFDHGKDFNPSEESVNKFGQRLAQHIHQRVAGSRGTPTLRLSNLGTECVRKLWYTINAPEKGEELPSETRFKFLYGDIIEELILFLAQEAGHLVEGQQDELDVAGVKGHRDAVIDGRLVDVKSASSFAFRKFASNGLREDDPFGYISQLGAYLHASAHDPLVTDKDVASFIAVDKQLGKIVLDTYPKPEVNYEEKVAEIRELLAKPEPPARTYEDEPDGKSGNRSLCTQCSYCAFKKECWPGLRTFLYSTGPKFLTQVEKAPKVVEIDENGVAVASF